MNNSNLIKLVTILLVVAVFTLHINQAKAAPLILLLDVWLLSFVPLAVQCISGNCTGLGHASFWGILSTILFGGIAPMIGQELCQNGQNNAWFTNCQGNTFTGTTTGQASGEPVLNNQSFTAACNSVSLNYDISNASSYAIFRTTAGATESTSVNSGSAQGLSNITYTDSNLTPQTDYQYILAMSDSVGTQYQYPPQIAYTQCRPECTFSVDKSQVVFPETATLSWTCSYADSCSISPTVGAVNAQSGTATVSPTSTTDYILTCQNADGSISFSSSLNVINPSIKEIKP